MEEQTEQRAGELLAQELGGAPEETPAQAETAAPAQTALPPRAEMPGQTAPPAQAGGPAGGTDPQRRAQDIQSFVRLFPGVQPEEVPGEVWEEVRRGKTLTESFQRWREKSLRDENERLRGRLAAAEKNGSNRRLSLGSQRSESAEQGGDPFLRALLADD